MGRIVMREEEMEGAVGALDKCYTDGDATAKQIANKFSKIMSTGLLDVGINTITNQMNSLTTSIFNVKNIIKKHSSEMFNMDRNMANIAEKIEVPQDFVKNNSMQEKTFEEYMFSKVDGRSVNSGTATSNVDGNTNTSVTNESLNNINNNLGVQNVNFDGNTTVVEENLNNVNQNTQTAKVDGNTNTSVISENLTDTNGDSETRSVAASSESTVNNQNLRNINNGNETRSVETLDGTTVNNENLRNINSGEGTRKVETFNETMVNSQDLRNMNNGSLTNMDLNGHLYDNQIYSNNINTAIKKPQDSKKKVDNE